MFCCRTQDLELSDKPQYQESPFKVKLLHALGLKEFAINRLVFARPNPTYVFNNKPMINEILLQNEVYYPPDDYTADNFILTTQTASIPIVHLYKKFETMKSLIIFSHGNGSDLSQSLDFVSSLAQLHQAEYIAYDYSGYGLSQSKKTTPESICTDLQTVIAWSNRPLDEIILVGFSLGCYPTAKVASQHKVKGVILLAPMMSLISLLQDEFRLSINSFYKNDEFSILEVIQNIESHLLIMHSQNDQIIPFKHSLVLFQRYTSLSKNPSVDLIEVAKIRHNQILTFLRSTKQNKLQKQFISFLATTQQRQPVHHFLQRKNVKGLKRTDKMSKQTIQLMKDKIQNHGKQSERISQLRLKKLRNSIKGN